VRALKYHGGKHKNDLGSEDLAALEKGMPNLLQHVQNIREVYGLPAVVAVNRFPTDAEAELAAVQRLCEAAGVSAVLSEVWAKGGGGALQLAEAVIGLCEAPNCFRFSYEDDRTLRQKIEAVAKKVYRADGVDYAAGVSKQLRRLEELGFGKLPVCIAKTQYSFSDDAAKRCAPRGFNITVRQVKVSAGAEFVVVLTGEVMTMPGLPKVPAAEAIDVDENGRITGLF